MFRQLCFCVVVALLGRYADSACTFPTDMVGSWFSSSLGTVTFTTSQVTLLNLHTFGNVTFDCDTLIGTKHLLRSTTPVTILGNSMSVVTCFDEITAITAGVKYRLQQATAKLTAPSNGRIRVLTAATALTEANTCTEPSPYAIGTNDLLIKDGSVALAYQQCPDELLGTFSYTYNTGSGDVCSSSGSYLDVCTDLTVMNFDLSICTTPVAYSSSGVMHCVYSQFDSSNNNTYLIVYNSDATTDESTTYRYTCLAVSSSGGVVYMSQNPEICQSGQTSTNGTEISTLEMTANYTCIPVDSTTTTPTTTTVIPTTTVIETTVTPAAIASANTAGIAIGITFALIVIFFLVVLCIFMFCGRERLGFYKKHCGGKCFTCCQATHSCMHGCMSGCSLCLSSFKRFMFRCAECCCPECDGQSSKVEPDVSQQSTVVVTIRPPSDDERRRHQNDQFMPIPPSVEEVDNVDSQGNPRRLPPIERRSTLTLESETDDGPQSPKSPMSPRLPPILSPRVSEDIQQAEELPNIPDTANVKDSPRDAPVVDMAPEEKVAEITRVQTPGPRTPTPNAADVNAGEANVSVTVADVEPVREPTPAGEATEESTIPETPIHTGDVQEPVHGEQTQNETPAGTPVPTQEAPPAKTPEPEMQTVQVDGADAKPEEVTDAAKTPEPTGSSPVPPPKTPEPEANVEPQQEVVPEPVKEPEPTPLEHSTPREGEGNA